MTPDPASYRTVLGHFATGVTVITAIDDGQPVGMAANSFTSVSLDPPLVLFCAAKTSSTWPQIERSGRFAVNILGEHQEDVCRVFAQKGDDRFARTGYRKSLMGSPLLPDVIAYLDCTIHAVHDAGDHVVVIGHVEDLGVGTEGVGGPLLFYRGGYAKLTL